MRYFSSPDDNIPCFHWDRPVLIAYGIVILLWHWNWHSIFVKAFSVFLVDRSSRCPFLQILVHSRHAVETSHTNRCIFQSNGALQVQRICGLCPRIEVPMSESLTCPFPRRWKLHAHSVY